MDVTPFTYGDGVLVASLDGEADRYASVCAPPAHPNDGYLVEYADGSAETVPVDRLRSYPD